jgi:hypothetical protein
VKPSSSSRELVSAVNQAIFVITHAWPGEGYWNMSMLIPSFSLCDF